MYVILIVKLFMWRALNMGYKDIINIQHGWLLRIEKCYGRNNFVINCGIQELCRYVRYLIFIFSNF